MLADCWLEYRPWLSKRTKRRLVRMTEQRQQELFDALPSYRPFLVSRYLSEQLGFKPKRLVWSRHWGDTAPVVKPTAKQVYVTPRSKAAKVARIDETKEILSKAVASVSALYRDDVLSVEARNQIVSQLHRAMASLEWARNRIETKPKER